MLCKLSRSRKDWSYTTKAYTFSGEECVSDCENSQCVINYDGEMKACYKTDDLPPVFYTSQTNDHSSSECKSNCGYFGRPETWCITKGGVFDNCNPSSEIPTQQSVIGNFCKKPCTYDLQMRAYYCLQMHNVFEPCAPPALIRIPEKPKPDLQNLATEKNLNCPQIATVAQNCQVSTENPNQKQCNCDCKNNAEYDKKDIYFKIEANIPHDMIEKVKGNQYHFTINFDSKRPDKKDDSGNRPPQKPEGTSLKENNEHTNQTDHNGNGNNTQDAKPDVNVSEHPSNYDQGTEQSDEIPAEMARSGFGKE